MDWSLTTFQDLENSISNDNRFLNGIFLIPPTCSELCIHAKVRKFQSKLSCLSFVFMNVKNITNVLTPENKLDYLLLIFNNDLGDKLQLIFTAPYHK